MAAFFFLTNKIERQLSLRSIFPAYPCISERILLETTRDRNIWRVRLFVVGDCLSSRTVNYSDHSLPQFLSTATPSPQRNPLGSRDGAGVRALTSHQCGPGSIPGLGVICGLSLLLVLVLAPRGFSPYGAEFVPRFPLLLEWANSC